MEGAHGQVQGGQQLRRGQKLPGVGSAVPDTIEATDIRPVISDVPSDLWPRDSTGQDSKSRVVAPELREEGCRRLLETRGA